MALPYPLELISNPNGFSIVDCPTLDRAARTAVLGHICQVVGKRYETLEDASTAVATLHFEYFKNKAARILPHDLFDKLNDEIMKFFGLIQDGRDFVTDEERMGYGNAYWRIVRANSKSDVGPIHADRWFWDLANGSLPEAYTRVKVWLPLIQDDKNPSLLLLPGSHQEEFTYSFHEDSLGKRRPYFDDPVISDMMTPAPVSTGQAVIFEDNLLHGGRVTSINRLSIEWTLAVYRS